jgi:predicted ATPase
MGRQTQSSKPSADLFIRAVRLAREKVPSFRKYPFCIPAVRHLERLPFGPGLTILIGENGVGKSTLMEAIAVKWGFNPEGGTRNFHFSTKDTHSELRNFIVLEKGTRRPTDGFFLRAESFYAFASEVDHLEKVDPGLLDSYGGKSLHDQSHGEAFLALLKNRLGGNGLYIFDEPEAALSPKRQLSVLVLIHDLIAQGSQCIIATHSPILMGYPGALIYEVGTEGIVKVNYEETDHFRITRDFLNKRERMLGFLFSDPEPTED